jgi:WD40 repeat protein
MIKLDRRGSVPFALALLATLVFRAFAFADDEGWVDLPITEELKKQNHGVFFRGHNQSIDTVKSRLNDVLRRRIDSIDRLCELTDPQKKRLELAGRGAIRQLFEHIDEQVQTLTWREFKNQNMVIRMLKEGPEVGQLRSQLRAGPFADDSFFGKSLASILTPEQYSKYSERPNLAAISNKPITLKNANDLVRISRQEKDVWRAVWTRDGTQMGLVPFNGDVEIYQPPDNKPVRILGEGKKVVDFDFSPRKEIVAFGQNSEIAVIIDTTTGKEIPIETGQSQPSVKFSPDGHLLATGGYGRVVKLWSAMNGELVRELDVGPNDGGLTPVFSPDGTHLAVGHRNSTTRLFDVATGELLQMFQSQMSQGLSFDPSGQTLAIAYVDGTLRLWDVKTGVQKLQAKPLAEELYTVGWSPDGSLLVTAGNSAQVTLWDASNLTMVREIESPEWVIMAGFSPDGTKLLFSGGSTTGKAGRSLETWAVP